MNGTAIGTAPDARPIGPAVGRVIAPIALVISSLTLATVIAFADRIPPQVHVLLVVGACGGYGVMIIADRRWGGLTIRLVGASVLAQSALAIAVPPRATADLWWYTVYGRIAAVHHANPYTHVAADYPSDTFMRHLGHAWRHTPSVYGPLFAGISGAASTLSGESLLTTRLVYQGLALAAVLGASVVVWRRTRSPGAVAFLTAHPVIALYIVNGGRNDILVGAALLGAAVLASQGHETSAGAAAGLGAMVKLTGLVGVVALVATLAAQRGRSAAQRATVAALAIMVSGYLVVGAAAVLTPMNTAGAMFSRASVWKLANRLIAPNPHLALAVAAIAVLIVVTRTRTSTPARSITASLTALTLGAAYTLPGYVAWALPTAALDHRSKVSRIAAAQGVLLVAGYAVFRHPFTGPTGAAFWWLASFGVPLLSLILLVHLIRAVRPNDRTPDALALAERPTSENTEPLMQTTLIVIPTYNERENLDTIVLRTRAAAPAADILVVDDASPDGTADAAEALAGSLGQITVLRRTGQRGLGPAYRDGFRFGLARGYDVIIEMDADLSHDPAAIPALIASVWDGADLAIGSRYIAGGATPNWPIHRRALSRAGCLYSRRILRLRTRDLTSGFRAYRASILDAIDLDAVDATGYGFQIQMAHYVSEAGGSIAEVPITFRDRVAGTSKMSPAIIAEAMILVTRWGIHARMHRAPRLHPAQPSPAL